jgi:hypothetical protein
MTIAQCNLIIYCEKPTCAFLIDCLTRPTRPQRIQQLQVLMKMTDWDDLHRRARNVIPRRELKARRCWIGVLSHEKAPEDELEETDFIWMMGHSVCFEHRLYQVHAHALTHL